MSMHKKVLITGSSGLIGSEAVAHFDRKGWDVHGVDNNMRREFFGPDGDTTWNLNRLKGSTKRFTHHNRDIRDRQGILDFIGELRPDLIIHCASQPSHDLAKDRPFDDFDVNAGGTLNLLEATRRACPESPFIFMSTNKVYGDAPNEIPLVEQETRWEYARPEDFHGVSEQCRIDASTHSLFGASKVAADVMVQEYGRYFNIPTVCLRGGCLTGPHHSGAELHGFLSYLAKATREGRKYRIFGYKGKQVRDNIHSHDVCTFFEAFYNAPRVAAVYNLGGGRENSVSMIEAIARFEALIGKKLDVEYIDQNRVGDHICYISDLRHIHADFPSWRQEYTLERTLAEIAAAGVKEQ
ncbi:NAD-dependent epimerase/dehydratase family protein [Chloroflexia bacterium SDU3-3]|nr:NAD-dependent epimerase/dehydratase family protein [Chloroflexia bacterium SDU3-3]